MTRLRTLEGLFDELLLASAGVCAQPRSPAARRLLRETRDRAQAWRRADLAVAQSEAALDPRPPEPVLRPFDELRVKAQDEALRRAQDEGEKALPTYRLPYRDD